jgi:uncharacterized protein (DUF1778 family)
VVGKETAAMSGAARKSRVDARFDLRLPEPAKNRIERAAEITGRTATEFVRAAADNAARKVLADHEKTVLTESDRKVFFAALLKPAKPSRALLDAAKRHKKLVTES